MYHQLQMEFTTNSGSVGTDTNTDEALFVDHVVNSVGENFAVRSLKIMIRHLPRNPVTSVGVELKSLMSD